MLSPFQTKVLLEQNKLNYSDENIEGKDREENVAVLLRLRKRLSSGVFVF